MNVLFDITHPADVHLFKNVIARLGAQGHRTLVASREKDVTLKLLDELGIEHVCLTRMGRGMAGMARELLIRNWKMLRLGRRFKPDVLVARIGLTIGPTGFLLRIPRLVIEDSEHAKLQLALSMPLASVILTGHGYLKDYGKRQARFNSMPVMAYLAPDVFVPDGNVLREHGVNPDEPFILLRVVSWQAVHDVGHQGADDRVARDAVRELSRFGRVLISSERPLPEDLRQYANPVPAALMHHLLALATLCIGEGGTIAAEAAVLGTPAIFTSPLRTGYLIALEERWRLCQNVPTLHEGLAAAVEWLSNPELKRDWAGRRERFLADCVDVNAVILEQIGRLANRTKGRSHV